MKSGDKVVFNHPDHEEEFLTLKQLEPDFAENLGNVWSVEENDIFLYQEKYLRKITPLEEIM